MLLKSADNPRIVSDIVPAATTEISIQMIPLNGAEICDEELCIGRPNPEKLQVLPHFRTVNIGNAREIDAASQSVQTIQIAAESWLTVC